MKKIILIALIILFIATPVLANSSYTYTIKHNIELQLDGDFGFESRVSTPSQGNVDIVLEGEGSAYLKSILEIIEKIVVTDNWFDLF